MRAALLAAGSLSSEIDSGRVQTLLSKPMRRYELVLGKWLGLAVLLGGYLLMMMGGMTLSAWLQTRNLPPNMFSGWLLVYLEMLVMMSGTLALSSKLPTIASGTGALGLFGVAFLGSWIEQIASAMNSQAAVNVGILTSLVLPTESLWRLAAYQMTTRLVQLVTGGLFVSGSVPSTLMVIYAFVYLAGAVALAMRWFGRRDM